MAVALASGSFTTTSFHLEKFFGIIEDNCSQIKPRLGDDLRLQNPTKSTSTWSGDQMLAAWFATARDTPSHLPRTAHGQSKAGLHLLSSDPAARWCLQQCMYTYCLF